MSEIVIQPGGFQSFYGGLQDGYNWGQSFLALDGTLGEFTFYADI